MTKECNIITSNYPSVVVLNVTKTRDSITSEWLTLKNVTKTCDCENPRRSKAKKVVIPPLTIAGPIEVKLNWARSSFDPEDEMKQKNHQKSACRFM